MGVNQLTGTPWHKERVHRDAGDARRYKGRCAFYEYARNYCNHYGTYCRGSAHCDKYQAISDAEFLRRQKQQKARKKSEDDVYWYR